MWSPQATRERLASLIGPGPVIVATKVEVTVQHSSGEA